MNTSWLVFFIFFISSCCNLNKDCECPQSGILVNFIGFDIDELGFFDVTQIDSKSIEIIDSVKLSKFSYTQLVVLDMKRKSFYVIKSSKFNINDTISDISFDIGKTFRSCGTCYNKGNFISCDYPKNISYKFRNKYYPTTHTRPITIEKE